MLRRVTLVRRKVSEERTSETSVLTRATRRNIPEDGILHSYCGEDLESYYVTGGLRKLHNEELRDVYSSPSIISMTKLRMIGWVGDVA
jgi:hypothetical protein